MRYMGASLVYKDVENNYVPWLAERWEATPDGLTWTFFLRKDIKFQDGTPLTANDFVYTFQRALDPATASPAAGQMLAQVDKLEAPDKYTFKVTLKEPYFPFLDNIAGPDYMQPLSKAAVEKYGDDYGRNPVVAGPYKLKEWVTGDHITLERNPEYAWQPPYAHQGPRYIQEITFRTIPEIATLVAALEAGEVDYADLDAQYIDRIEATGNFNILEYVSTSTGPYVAFNITKPPFDDLKVRQAINYAIDRQTLIDVILKGKGVIQYGPLSPSVTGYWSGVEKIGYGFDLEKAKSLMAEAGYQPGPDGILVKDGKPLKFDLTTLPDWVKDAQMLKEQLKALGVDANIVQQENAVLIGNVVTGEYGISLFAYAFSNADILWLTAHSAQEGILNLYHVKNTELDEALDKTRTEIDPVKQADWAGKAQQIFVENALMAPLYNQTMYTVLSTKVKGFAFSPKNQTVYLEDAYIQE